MMSLSIADRRAITIESFQNPSFRSALQSDPKRAISGFIGVQLSESTNVQILPDDGVTWSFVLIDPSLIDATLPAAMDERSTVENEVYALLRDKPALAAEAESDPAGFLRNHLKIDVSRVNLRREEPGDLIIIEPTWTQDELSDELLDLVSAGGDPNCQSGYIRNPYNSNPAPR